MTVAIGKSVGLASLVLALAAGCSSQSDGAASNSSTDGLVLTCQTLSVKAGQIGSAQKSGALAKAELTGTKDVWKDYVEFAPGSSVVCSFTLPASTPVSTVTGLSLGVNYRGPSKANMTWQFDAWDAVAQAWVAVGDNGFAQDWIWSPATLPLAGPVARYVGGSQILVRFGTTSTVDSSDLDQWVVKVATGTVSGGGATDMGTTTGSGDMSSSSHPGDMAGSSQPGDMSTTTAPGSIWQPHPGTSWQWQLSGTLDTSLNVQMYDIDLFDNSAQVIAGLKAQGKKVICYLSAGTYENWRSDAAQFPKAAIGSGVAGWPGENWLDTRDATVRNIMLARMDLAVSKGCDGIEPDNVDGYTNSPGFPLTYATQIDYDTFLATSAHARKLAVALKNDLDQVKDLVASFDFALNEQCFQYSECDLLQPFVTANKAVFEVEYGAASLATTVCPKANTANLDTLIKDLDLDAFRVSCR